MREQDQIIVAQIQADRLEDAFRTLYRICHEEVVNDIAYNGGTREDGEDIFQEALMIMVRKIQKDEFRGESTLKTYVKGIARHLWMSEQRARDRRKTREVNYVTQSDISENPMLWRSPQQEFALLLDKIGDICKTLLIGFYFEDKDVKALTQMLGLKTEQVLRNRKSICIKRLRDALKDKKHLVQSLLTDSHYE